jgi:hypothetical protein
MYFVLVHFISTQAQETIQAVEHKQPPETSSIQFATIQQRRQQHGTRENNPRQTAATLAQRNPPPAQNAP